MKRLLLLAALLLAVLTSVCLPQTAEEMEKSELVWAVVMFLDPNALLIGMNDGELKVAGELIYPEEGKLLNRAGHRLGSKILTDRWGFEVAITLGVLNEVWEAENLRFTGEPYFSTTRFDFEDLAANLRGVHDSFAHDLNTPYGLLRLALDPPGL